MRWKKAVKPLIGVATGGSLLVWGAGVALAGPGAPTGLTFTRDAADPHRVTVSWAAVDGATKYNVSVTDGLNEKVNIVDGDTTSYALTDIADCARVKVKVSSRDASGKGSSSKSVWMDTLGAGEPVATKAVRSADGTSVTLTWQPPDHQGRSPVTGYEVRGSGDYFYQTRTVSGLTTTFTGLRANSDFRGSVLPINGYQACGVGVADAKVKADPASVTGLKATRDPADPDRVTVTWTAPADTHGSTVAYYDFSAGVDSPFFEFKVNGTSHVYQSPESWPEDQGRVFRVYPVFADGTQGPPVLVSLPALLKGKIKPTVKVEHLYGRLSAKLDVQAGRYDAYPNVVLRIAGADGYRNEQWMEPDSHSITVYDIPKGTYTVTVSGVNELAEEEWSKETVEIGGDAVTEAKYFETDYDLWQTGWQDPTGTLASYFNTFHKPLGSKDQTVGYTLTGDYGGGGYGTMLRVTSEPYVTGSGLLMTYHPEYTETVNGQKLTGPAFTLRKVGSTKPCDKMLAVAFAPPGTSGYGAFRVVTSVVGNSFTTTVNGKTVLEVADLEATNAAACGGVLPNGNEVSIGHRDDPFNPLRGFSNFTVRSGE